jgi:hypothetical protein
MIRAIKAAWAWWTSLGKFAPEDYEQRKPYRLHMWDREDRCIWCRRDKLQWSECQPCPGPRVSA